MKLMNHVYQIAGVSLSHSNDASAYLIEGEHHLYLIDCGTPEGFAQIEANIKSLGFDPSMIYSIYGTHGHYDHVGAASLWKERYGCQFYLHQADSRQVEAADQMKTTAELLYGCQFPACHVDRYLAEGDREDWGHGLTAEVLHTPGHTAGSICLALDCNGYHFLVAGDTLWGGYSTQIGSDEKRWLESLDKLVARHFDGYSFGHVGANVIADADTRLKEARRQFAIYYNPWFKPMKESFKYN